MSKQAIKLDRIITIFFILLLSTTVAGFAYKRGFQIGYAWEGTDNTLSPGYVEGFEANFSGVYTPWIELGGNNQSDWPTGGVPHDQDLNTTDNVAFNSINATEFYLSSVNITERLEGNYSETGLITAWLELNGVNRSVWPSGGISNFSHLPIDYVIYYNSTDSTYKAVNGSTGAIDYSNANPITTIENVWSHLGGLGGGSFRTIGPGETWTINGNISSQGPNVKWVSDWSLTIKLANGLNLSMIYVSHDFTKIEGLRLDGNCKNTLDPKASLYGCGIVVHKADDVEIEGCYFEDIRKFGIWVLGTSGDYAERPILSKNRMNNTQWNGIQAGSYSSLGVLHMNLINYFGDVGITIVGWGFVASNNIAMNGIGTNGSVNSGYGFMNEEFGIAGKYNEYDANIAYDCKAGFVFSTNSERCTWSDGTVINYNLQLGSWDFQGWLQGYNHSIKNSRFIDLADSAQDVGIKLSVGSNGIVEGNELINFLRAIQLDNNADNYLIFDNKITNSSVGIHINAATCEDNDLTGGNYFETVTDYLVDNGVGTKLPSISVPFIEGSTWNTESDGYGWNITSGGNYAATYIIPPPNLHSIEKLKFYAITWQTEGDGMKLEIQARAGEDDELWTAETISVTNKTSTTLSITYGDRIHWSISSSDDSDLADILAEEVLVVWVLHEVAGGDDIATNCIMQTMRLEYI